MQKNKIILKKIRNVILLGMIIIIMLGAYYNIRKSRAEDIIEIAVGAIDGYGYLEYEEFKLEAKEIKNDLYEIELPESINTKKVNKILEVTLEDSETEKVTSEDEVEENTTTENTLIENTVTENTVTENVVTENTVIDEANNTIEEHFADGSDLTANKLQTVTSADDESTNETAGDTATENVTEENNSIEIVENKIYLTQEELDNKQINLKVEYDVAILEKDAEGKYNKVLLSEKSEEERNALNITDETEILYKKILEHEDETKGKIVEVKGYLPKEAKLQVNEVSQAKIELVFGNKSIDVAYDIKIVVEDIKTELLDKTNPEAGTTQIVETREINPEDFGETCEVSIKDINIGTGAQVYHVKDDNTYEEVTVKESTEQNVSFEAQNFSIYAVSSNNDFAEIKDNNTTSSVGLATYEVRRCYNS